MYINSDNIVADRALATLVLGLVSFTFYNYRIDRLVGPLFVLALSQPRTSFKPYIWFQYQDPNGLKGGPNWDFLAYGGSGLKVTNYRLFRGG